MGDRGVRPGRGDELMTTIQPQICTCQFGAMSVMLDDPMLEDPHGAECPLSRSSYEERWFDDPEFQRYLERQWHEKAVEWAEENGYDPHDPQVDEMFADHEAAWAETYAENAAWDRGCGR